MKFKIKRILNDRQLRKAKWSVCAALVFLACTYSQSLLVSAEDPITYNGEEYTSTDTEEYGNGKIVYFSKNVEVCTR